MSATARDVIESSDSGEAETVALRDRALALLKEEEIAATRCAERAEKLRTIIRLADASIAGFRRNREHAQFLLSMGEGA